MKKILLIFLVLCISAFIFLPNIVNSQTTNSTKNANLIIEKIVINNKGIKGPQDFTFILNTDPPTLPNGRLISGTYHYNNNGINSFFLPQGTKFIIIEYPLPDYDNSVQGQCAGTIGNNTFTCIISSLDKSNNLQPPTTNETQTNGTAVPEFGHLAGIVAAVSIVGAVIFSRSRSHPFLN